MTDFSQLLQQGTTSAWIFIPTAIALGALHGLEPGHSKTMMAAFIIAVRGTIKQAILLGLCAAFSHSLIIWLLAAVALKFGSRWNAETTEPYFQLASAMIIAGLALWMLWRTRRDLAASEAATQNHSHDDTKTIDTGHGTVELSVFETGVPPVFRLRFFEHGRPAAWPKIEGVTLETVRPAGEKQPFAFAARDGFLESTTAIPEPHEFEAILLLGHGDHTHTYRVPFAEGHHHAPLPPGAEYEDAHERAHASEIQQRFSQREVTTGQIMLFGLTGGLLPCPAAFSVLIICLQLKRFSLGFALVLAFSLGLAITLVVSGTIAAWSVRHAQKRFSGFGQIVRRLPYLSSAFLLLVACYVGYLGYRGLHP